MRYLAWLIAFVIVAAGVAGIVTPDRLTSLRWLVATQGGLLGIAVFRVAVGVVLIMIAPASRAPKTLQVFGAVALLGGMVTPLFGVERSKAVLDWEIAQGPSIIRAEAAVAVAIGGFLALAVRPARPSH